MARFSFGLTKKDDTGKVIDLFVEGIEKNSSGGFCNEIRTARRAYTTFTDSFLHIRQAGLQLHASVHLKDRKLPKLAPLPKNIFVSSRSRPARRARVELRPLHRSLRAIALHQHDLQAMQDNWINTEKMPFIWILSGGSSNTFSLPT